MKEPENNEQNIEAAHVPDEMMGEQNPILGDDVLPEEVEQPDVDEAADNDNIVPSEEESGDKPAVQEEPEYSGTSSATASAAMQAAMEFTSHRRGRRSTPQAEPAETALNSRSRTAAPVQQPNADDFLPAESLIKSAKSTRRLLEGTVSSTALDAENNPCAIVMMDAIPVFIPYKEFFPNRSSHGVQQRELAALRVCIGAKIEFVITGYERVSSPVDRGHFVGRATGSRIPAMRFQQARYFGPNARNRVEVGSVMQGTVLSVHNTGRSLTAYVCGIDRNITLGELSESYANNVAELGYYAGAPITVKVRDDLARDDKGNVTRINFSAREYEEEQNIARIRDLVAAGVLTVGAQMVGTVRHLGSDRRTGTPVYYVALEAYPATVRATRQYVQTGALSALPSRGSKVMVQIANVVPERGILNGMITRTIRQSPL